MKKIFTAAIITLSVSYSAAGDLKVYRDTPLFNSVAYENSLPYGEYFLVRSYRNTTQLVVAFDKKVVLYTDRDNQRDSEIYASAYSPVEEIILNVPAIQQHEFNVTIESLIRKGDSNFDSAIPFPGGAKFIQEIKKDTKPQKIEGEYFLYIYESSKPLSIMTINISLKKLTLRNMTDKNKIPSAYYSIYIDECYDKNIKKIIREYAALIKN